MQDVSWLCFRVSARAENSELVAHALREIGCDGVQIEDTDLKDRGEDADFLAREEIRVLGYLQLNGDERESHEKLRQRLEKMLGEYSVAARIETEKLDAKDWSTSWRENFPVLEIGKFLIAPTWEEIPDEEIAADKNKIVIRLDPGLAFGTGQHPTTQMCLEILGENQGQIQGANLLDAGCGSGVLSIAASKLGADVTASDLDPFCIDATKENAALNDVELTVVQAAGLDWCQEKFDVVVANLMSDLLISLAPELARVCRDGSTLMVSGISAPRADDVENALQNAGFHTREKRERDGELRSETLERWAAFVFTNQRNS